MPNNDDDDEGKERKKFELPEIEVEKLRVYQFNDKLGDFEELEIAEDFPLYELFDSDFILLVVDPTSYRVWLWHGANTTTRMKFIAAKIAPKIRDRYGIAYKITAVDEGNETTGFKISSGLEKATDYEEAPKGPIYDEGLEAEEMLKSLPREKIVLILEKTGIPEGYKRKMVIVKNQIYGYKEYDRNYMGSVIKEKKLFLLKEEVPDGPYLAENYVPRILFSYNNVVLTELLEKNTNGIKPKEDN